MTEQYKKYLQENQPESCEACGGTLEQEEINLEDYQGGKLYIMENIPALVCQDCGEVWVPEPAMKDFEKMISTAKNRTAAKLGKPKIKRKGK